VKILGQEMHSVYKHKTLKFSNGLHMEFDAFFPGLSLAVEYQGIHHFEANEFFAGFDAQQKRYLEFRV